MEVLDSLDYDIQELNLCDCGRPSAGANCISADAISGLIQWSYSQLSGYRLLELTQHTASKAFS
jgi:hypothetical protein